MPAVHPSPSTPNRIGRPGAADSCAQPGQNPRWPPACPVHQPVPACAIPPFGPNWPPLAPDLLVVAAYGLILPPAVLAIPDWAASTSMPRCCRAGAARRRSSARCWPATPKPASASCAWKPVWIPGRCWPGPPARFLAGRPAASCTTDWPRWVPTRCGRRCRICWPDD
jgi:hypothetical protein